MKQTKTLFISVMVLLGTQHLGESQGRAAGFNDAIKLAPRAGDVFVGVDHVQLLVHQDRDPLTRLAVKRGLLPAVVLEDGACLRSGKQVLRTIAVRLPAGRSVHILEGKLNRKCTESHFKQRLSVPLKKAKRPFSGTISNMPFVAVSGGEVALFVDKKTAIVGKASALETVADDVLKGRKSVMNDRVKRKLFQSATKARSILWSFSKIPERIRKRYRGTNDAAFANVRSFVLTAVGSSRADIALRCDFQSSKQALKLKSVLQTRLRERVGNSMILRALGIASMIEEGFKLAARGRVMEAKIAISPLQMGILARSGGKILAILE